MVGSRRAGDVSRLEFRFPVVNKSETIDHIERVTGVFTEDKVEPREWVTIALIPAIIWIVSVVQISYRLSRDLRRVAVKVDIRTNVTIKAVAVDFRINP